MHIITSKTQAQFNREHGQIVQKHIGGPKESYIGKGPGITEPIGVNAHQMVETMMNPKFIEAAFGERPFLDAIDRRSELEHVGAVGKFAGTAGMSQKGDMQYLGSMPEPLFHLLQWTDPTIFQDEKRLLDYLRKAHLANA